MIAIVCVDDNNGMLFNQRRQSRDAVLRSRILALTREKPLWMNAYSAAQFAEEAPQIRVEEAFLDKADKGSYAFVETEPLQPYESKIERLILYRWNRSYPFDLQFDLDLSDWALLRTAEFPGKSHEKITEEVYERKVSHK